MKIGISCVILLTGHWRSLSPLSLAPLPSPLPLLHPSHYPGTTWRCYSVPEVASPSPVLERLGSLTSRSTSPSPVLRRIWEPHLLGAPLRPGSYMNCPPSPQARTMGSSAQRLGLQPRLQLVRLISRPVTGLSPLPDFLPSSLRSAFSC